MTSERALATAPPTPVVLLGPGKVGRSFLAQLREHGAGGGAPLLYPLCVADSRGCVASPDLASGLRAEEVDALVARKVEGAALSSLTASGRLEDWLEASAPALRGAGLCPIVVDASAGETGELLARCRALGWRIALANKVPLTGGQAVFEALTRDAAAARWEATVAAALPVVETLRTLVDRSDGVRRVEGCVSGTLGFVTSRLAEGERLSRVVAEASTLGYVEPDPRDDLSGRDSARKGLIIARMLGLRMDMDDIEVEGLYPADWDALPLREFLDRLPELDDGLSGRSVGAAMSGRTLRYRFTIVDGRLRTALEDLSPKHPLARVAPSDSIVLFETETFAEHPLILSGRGGGPRATAACLLGDVIQLARGGGAP